ncbi:MAG: metal-dependent transcriptional regulator [bacterium]|nr:metal-dependent transcriptional regulator [bacterium]
MNYNESIEMYLETIHILSKKQSVVKSIDVANELNYARASVSRALKLMLEKNYISLDNKKNIILTKEGLDIANKIYDRHVTITKLLESIGVSKKIAEDDACKIEHVISDETMVAIKKYFDK